jgi:phage terminase small subunit
MKNGYRVDYKTDKGNFTVYCDTFQDMMNLVTELQKQDIQLTHYGKVATKKELARTKRDLASF